MRLTLSLLLLLAGTLPGPLVPDLRAQDAVVRVEENVRFEPQGLIVGQLQAGTPVRIEGREGSWRQVTFEGVVWENSLQRREGGSFDLIVSASEGENLRSEPGGAVVGRLNSGTLLNEVSRSAGWIRVRRTAWMWAPSLDEEGGAAVPPPSSATPAPATRPSPPPSQSPAPPSATPPGGEDWLRAGTRGTPLLAAPDGDTLGIARAGAALQVAGREGNWARVRIEGWVWVPATGTASGDEGPETTVVLRDLTPAGIAREPERYRGRMVAFQVQFISLERAEAVRTDFFEGEPFVLARSVESDRTFVYLAVPDEQMEEIRRLQPLERIEVVGRVRAGAAALTGNPVLDLLEFRRIR